MLNPARQAERGFLPAVVFDTVHTPTFAPVTVPFESLLVASEWLRFWMEKLADIAAACKQWLPKKEMPNAEPKRQ